MSYPRTTDRWVLTMTTTANAKNQPPSAATKNGTSVDSTQYLNIPVAGCDSIGLTTNETAGNSTSMDANVHASHDGGSTYDSSDVADGTEAPHIYAPMNLTTATSGRKSMSVTPGPTHIRVKTDENSNNAIAGTIVLTVTWR